MDARPITFQEHVHVRLFFPLYILPFSFLPFCISTFLHFLLTLDLGLPWLALARLGSSWLALARPGSLGLALCCLLWCCGRLIDRSYRHWAWTRQRSTSKPPPSPQTPSSVSALVPFFFLSLLLSFSLHCSPVWCLACILARHLARLLRPSLAPSLSLSLRSLDRSVARSADTPKETKTNPQTGQAQNQVVVVDLRDDAPSEPLRRPITADAALMHPSDKVPFSLPFLPSFSDSCPTDYRTKR